MAKKILFPYLSEGNIPGAVEIDDPFEYFAERIKEGYQWIKNRIQAFKERKKLAPSKLEHLIEGSHCLVCGNGFSEEYIECSDCKTPHHVDCWDYIGGCSVYGCRKTGLIFHSGKHEFKF